MTLIFYGLQIFILALISYEDWRTKRISLLTVLAFTALSFGGLLYSHFPINDPMITVTIGILIFVKLFGFLAYGKNLMGNGDLILLIPLLASLHLSELPFFLMISGIAGLITALITQEHSIPFVPALSLAYLIVLFLRLY